MDAAEEVEFGELHLFLGEDFAITVRHSESPDLSRVRRRLESEPDLLAKGSEAVLYAILDAVVDGYVPVVAGLANDIDEIETEVFGGDPGASRRIYELSQEVLDFQRAAQPLTGILAAITAGFDKYGVDEELRSYLRDVADHVAQVTERVEGFRLQLRDILTVNATLVAQRQNEEIRELTEASIAQGEEVKKISAWAAILFAPDARRHRLRDELRRDAGAALVARLPVRAAGDARGERGAVRRLQAPGLDLAAGVPRERRRAAVCATVRNVIRLVPVTADLLDAAIVGDDDLARALGHDVTPGWMTFREALEATRAALAASPRSSTWGTRFFVG